MGSLDQPSWVVAEAHSFAFRWRMVSTSLLTGSSGGSDAAGFLFRRMIIFWRGLANICFLNSSNGLRSEERFK